MLDIVRISMQEPNEFSGRAVLQETWCWSQPPQRWTGASQFKRRRLRPGPRIQSQGRTEDSLGDRAAAATYSLVGALPKGRGLADQARRAAASVALNTSEGLAARGAQRAKALKIAYMECREAKTAVQLLAVTEQVDLQKARDAWRLLDRSGARLWRMT